METRLEELKRYVSFTADDARSLVAFGRVAAPDFPRIAREFYDKIREHEHAHAVFRDEEQIVRLQGSLVRWLGRLCSGIYDEAYREETAKIGRVHVKVGLPERYMFTAMALIRVSLMHIVDERMGAEARATSSALMRLLDLELAMMVEAYREDVAAHVQRVETLERSALNRTLARTEHRYVNAVELAPVLILGLDEGGLIRLYNREAERVTGFTRLEVEGKPFAATLLQEDLVESDGAKIRGAILRASGDRETVYSAVRTRAGKYRDVRFHLAYAPAEGDDDVVLFVIGTDITGENVLAERTRRAETLAAVGTLAAGLAHEIRNPLNGAQLHVAFLGRALARTGAAADVIEAVNVVGDEIRRLAGLVTEFLDFARPRPPQRNPLSVFAVGERAVQIVAAQAEAAQVALVKDLPTRDVEILADGAKVEQVLLNLLKNAIEAVALAGGGTVTLRVRRQPRHVHIEVEDDGPGILPPDMPIFDPFFSTKTDGTGLGLPITHRIVTDHQGTITFESQPGRTLFRVALPLDAE